MEIHEFTLDDIFDYFRQKGGKVIYTELVTHFKTALSNPQTQANARVLFKNYVNSLANVINEDGKKYLILRTKYMKKLFEMPSSIISPIKDTSSPSANFLSNGSQNDLKEQKKEYNGHSTIKMSNNVNNAKTMIPDHCFNSSFVETNKIHQQYPTNSTSEAITSSNNINLPPKSLTTTSSSQHPKSPSKSSNVLPIITEININYNSSISPLLNNGNDEPLDLPPPRPPPRKKNSFSKALKPTTITSPTSAASTPTSANVLRNSSHHNQQQHTNDTLVDQFESINTVKKEIQELSLTPGRVKEHAQILNKLALDTKLPMPTTNSVSQVVNNKIRNSNTHSDTDSSSVHLIDPLKKRWIIASSNCDFQEILSLLKQDPELCRYCDCIMGYSVLHWAAKFNKPEIIKLIAGNFKVDPNIKSFSGSTPLHIAAQFKNDEIMKILVYHYGANKELRDNYGKKPYQYLEKKNELEVNQPTKPLSENFNPMNHNSVPNGSSATSLSAKENLKNNLRNKISHQSMLVRNTLRNTKAFKRRKSMNEKSKHKKQQNLATPP